MHILFDVGFFLLGVVAGHYYPVLWDKLSTAGAAVKRWFGKKGS